MRLIQEGSRNAKIVIVGEAPGANEDARGVPFIGGSGMILNRVLESAGIRRSDCFITNVCHVRPEKNEFGWFLKKANQHHLIAGMLQLKKDLEEIKPNLVIALGSQPLKILTGHTGIDSWRGSILPCTLVKGLKVIGTYHPAYVMRVWEYKAICEFDVRRCADEAKFPEMKMPTYEFLLGDRHESFTPHQPPELLPPSPRFGWIQEMLRAEWLSVDIECWKRDNGTWALACVGFSDRGDRALVIPINGSEDIEDVRLILACPAKKVFQNGTFDVTVLRDEGITVNNFAWDTMLGHHALFPECAGGEDEMSALSGKKRSAAIKKGLAFQCSIYTKQPFYKDDGKLWQETNDLTMFWRYNALDVACTRLIRDVQEKELREFGTLPVLEHEMALVIPCMAMTKKGIKIDMAEREKMHKRIEGEIVNLQAFLDAGAGEAFNVKSNPQIAKLLFEKLGFKPIKYSDKTAKPSADKDVLNALAEKHQNPLLHTIIHIRERRDMIERYLNAAISADGRMRCSWDITGTRSGRLSSRASLEGSGTNLQNIPPSMRRMFVADPGKVFVYRDFSQAEARVVAFLARCTGLIELFSDPTRDIHRENAARINSIPLDSVTPEQRYLAKRVVHASHYGMGPGHMVEVVNEDAELTGVRINFPTAKRLIESYFMLYPELQSNYWGDIQREMKRSLTLNTPFGRKRTFFGRWDEKLMREAYSYVPQSTIGDLCCKALVRCYWDIDVAHPEWGANTLLNVHDSLLVQCNDDPATIKAVAEAMAQAMDISMTVNFYDFKVPTDCKVGYNWMDYNKKNPDDNPKGLKEYKG